MLWFLRKFRIIIVTVSTLIGIYYAPVDTIGIEDATAPWRTVVSMVDQNTALWVFSVLCATYIVWLEVRPYVVDIFWGRIRVRFAYMIPTKYPDKLDTMAIFEITNSTRKSISDISIKFTLWQNGRQSSQDMPVRWVQPKSPPTNMHPSDRIRVLVAHGESRNGIGVTSAGVLETADVAANPIYMHRSYNDIVGELRVVWADGGPVVLLVHFSIGEDGILRCAEVTEKQAKALSLSNPVLQTNPTKPRL